MELSDTDVDGLNKIVYQKNVVHPSNAQQARRHSPSSVESEEDTPKFLRKITNPGNHAHIIKADPSQISNDREMSALLTDIDEIIASCYLIPRKRMTYDVPVTQSQHYQTVSTTVPPQSLPQKQFRIVPDEKQSRQVIEDHGSSSSSSVAMPQKLQRTSIMQDNTSESITEEQPEYEQEKIHFKRKKRGESSTPYGTTPTKTISQSKHNLSMSDSLMIHNSANKQPGSPINSTHNSHRPTSIEEHQRGSIAEEHHEQEDANYSLDLLKRPSLQSTERENETPSESLSTQNEANPAGEYITTETYEDDFESYLGTWSNINDTSIRRFSKLSQAEATPKTIGSNFDTVHMVEPSADRLSSDKVDKDQVDVSTDSGKKQSLLSKQRVETASRSPKSLGQSVAQSKSPQAVSRERKSPKAHLREATSPKSQVQEQIYVKSLMNDVNALPPRPNKSQRSKSKGKSSKSSSTRKLDSSSARNKIPMKKSASSSSQKNLGSVKSILSSELNQTQKQGKANSRNVTPEKRMIAQRQSQLSESKKSQAQSYKSDPSPKRTRPVKSNHRQIKNENKNIEDGVQGESTQDEKVQVPVDTVIQSNASRKSEDTIPLHFSNQGQIEKESNTREVDAIPSAEQSPLAESQETVERISLQYPLVSVLAKTPDDRDFIIDLPANGTFAAAKQFILEQHGVQLGEITFNGFPVDENRRISSYGMKSGDLLFIDSIENCDEFVTALGKQGPHPSNEAPTAYKLRLPPNPTEVDSDNEIASDLESTQGKIKNDTDRRDENAMYDLDRINKEYKQDRRATAKSIKAAKRAYDPARNLEWKQNQAEIAEQLSNMNGDFKRVLQSAESDRPYYYFNSDGSINEFNHERPATHIGRHTETHVATDRCKSDNAADTARTQNSLVILDRTETPEPLPNSPNSQLPLDPMKSERSQYTVPGDHFEHYHRSTPEPYPDVHAPESSPNPQRSERSVATLPGDKFIHEHRSTPEPYEDLQQGEDTPTRQRTERSEKFTPEAPNHPDYAYVFEGQATDRENRQSTSEERKSASQDKRSSVGNITTPEPWQTERTIHTQSAQSGLDLRPVSNEITTPSAQLTQITVLSKNNKADEQLGKRNPSLPEPHVERGDSLYTSPDRQPAAEPDDETTPKTSQRGHRGLLKSLPEKPSTLEEIADIRKKLEAMKGEFTPSNEEAEKIRNSMGVLPVGIGVHTHTYSFRNPHSFTSNEFGANSQLSETLTVPYGINMKDVKINKRRKVSPFVIEKGSGDKKSQDAVKSRHRNTNRPAIPKSTSHSAFGIKHKSRKRVPTEKTTERNAYSTIKLPTLDRSITPDLPKVLNATSDMDLKAKSVANRYLTPDKQMNSTLQQRTKQSPPRREKRVANKSASDRSLFRYHPRGKSPFEIIADFNRQEVEKLDFFNRANITKHSGTYDEVKLANKYSLYDKYVKELQKIRKLETSLPNDVLEAYVTSDPLYKQYNNVINKAEISRQVLDSSRSVSLSPDPYKNRSKSNSPSPNRNGSHDAAIRSELKGMKKGKRVRSKQLKKIDYVLSQLKKEMAKT